MSEFTTEDGYCSSFAAHQLDFDGASRQQPDLQHRSTLRCFRKARGSDVRVVQLVRGPTSHHGCVLFITRTLFVLAVLKTYYTVRISWDHTSRLGQGKKQRFTTNKVFRLF